MKSLPLIVLLLCTSGAEAAERGVASRYCDLKQTASGRAVTCKDLVAAHRTLPFGTQVKVKNLSNGKTVNVMIVDRGPFTAGRIIDLTTAAADHIEAGDLTDVEISVEPVRH